MNRGGAAITLTEPGFFCWLRPSPKRSTLRNNFNYSKSDIFKPQTRQFGEITVLYTQLADEKLRVNCVRSVEKIALLLSKEYLD
jgi:hypothetical protein